MANTDDGDGIATIQGTSFDSCRPAGLHFHPLDEDGALPLLQRTLKHDGVYMHRFFLDCVTYRTEEATDAYCQFVLRENQAQRGGDP